MRPGMNARPWSRERLRGDDRGRVGFRGRAHRGFCRAEGGERSSGEVVQTISRLVVGVSLGL